jgi:hypothetical protein
MFIGAKKFARSPAPSPLAKSVVFASFAAQGDLCRAEGVRYVKFLLAIG